MIKKYAVGDVRPSQLLLTYGVGAIIDLPHLSTLIMGLDDWDTSNMQEISEERLLQALQSTLGPQVKRLLSPPHSPDTPQGPFDPAALIGCRWRLFRAGWSARAATCWPRWSPATSS